MILKHSVPRGWSAPILGQYTCLLPWHSKILSETAWPVKSKFYMKHLYEGGTNVYINNLGHMTKVAIMPIYGKNPSKFFSGTNGLPTKLDM